ncbi:MAG: T9SS type A sorting domain-containing protein [bacterium]
MIKEVLGISAFILLLFVMLYFSNSDQPQIAPEDLKISGALKSLNVWSEQRAYPYKTIPKQGFYTAYQYAKNNLSSSLDSDQIPPWQAIGPHNIGGRTLAIAFNPQNPNTVYAGSASGGLWRSFSGGVGAQAWEYVSTGFPVLAVSTIAFAPADSNTIYIGTGEVYNYQNAGTGFTVRPTRGSYGIGILKTTDGGQNWTSSLDWTLNQERGVWAVRVNPLNPNTVWAGTTEGTFKSTDAGETWTKVHEVIMIMDLAVNPVDTNTVFIGAGNLFSAGLGVYRTRDGGENWTKMTGFPSSYGGKAMLAISPSSPNVVYASVGNGTSSQTGATWLMRSIDNGNSWTQISQRDYSRWQGWFAHDVAVHPQNPNEIMTVGIDIWKSTNGGVSLSQKSNWTSWFFGRTLPGEPEGTPDYSHADHHDVAYHPTNPDIIYFANDGGVFRSLDGGETFDGCNGGYQTTQFYQGFDSSTNDSLLSIGGMQDNSTAIYDGQLAWIRVVGGDGGFAAIDPSDSRILYASSQNLNIWKSELPLSIHARLSDGGENIENWINLAPQRTGRVSFIAPYAISPANPRTLYAGRSVIFRSTNSGGFWAIRNGGNELDGNPILAMALSHQNSFNLYVTTAPTITRAGVFRSKNAAADMTNITADLPDRFPVDIAVDPNNDDIVYVTFSGFGTSHLFKSTDEGNQWQDIGQTLPDVPTSAVVVDPLFPEHIYVGNDLGVYLSIDGGLSWQEFMAGMPDAMLVMDLSISPVNRKLRAATHGNGVFERDLVDDQFTSVPDAAPVSLDFRLAQNYPNPFNPSTTIEYELPAAASVVVTVYNILGEKVVTLVNEFQNAGVQSVAWDGRNAAGRPVVSGVYLYKIRAGEFTASKKMTLTK